MEDSPASGSLAHLRHELPHDVDIDVGFTMDFSHHSEAFSHVGFGEFSFAAKDLEGGLKTFL